MAGVHPHVVHLQADDVTLVVDTATGAPTILHWGRTLGDPDQVDAIATARALERPVAVGGLDLVAPTTIVPGHGDGHPGPPAIEVHRADGTAWAPRFVTDAVEATATAVTVAARDPVARLGLRTEIELDPHGVVHVRAHLANEGGDDLWVQRLDLALPVPGGPAELLTLTGRWALEGVVVRRPFEVGATAMENRLGRTSHEALPFVAAGSVGFGEWRGEVRAVHLGWSGNHRTGAVGLPDGRRHLFAGALLHPGEIRLAPGGSFATPELLGSWSDAGLGPASRRFHRLVRSRPHHPGPDRPRPVTLNTWEAVYFDHDAATLRALADRAAAVGVERFVLDDGWFGSRRDDRSGLGDWFVSPDAHPDGLGPLIDHVRGLGMEFGIWVEPEMVNEDSDLYRAHPDWALVTPGYEPVRGRAQLVLDLGRPEAFEHLLGRLDALLADHDIAYVKWDMNRPHVQGSGADGRAGSHRQTLAVYRLLDELRRRHPGVEFETCSGGGGRIDLEILRRTERVWASDCIDALDRQHIQRGLSMLVPPEVTGSHIGAPRAHTTGRRHRFAFRAATAMFGHLGIEWNLLECDDRELEGLAEVVALHTRHRRLLHSGDAVRFDPDDDAGIAHGVYAADRLEALVSYARVASGVSLTPAPLRLPGLVADARYRVTHVALPGEYWGWAGHQPGWLADGLELTGAQLAAHGVQLPVLLPESAILLHLVADQTTTESNSPEPTR